MPRLTDVWFNASQHIHDGSSSQPYLEHMLKHVYTEVEIYVPVPPLLTRGVNRTLTGDFDAGEFLGELPPIVEQVRIARANDCKVWLTFDGHHQSGQGAAGYHAPPPSNRRELFFPHYQAAEVASLARQFVVEVRKLGVSVSTVEIENEPVFQREQEERALAGESYGAAVRAYKTKAWGNSVLHSSGDILEALGLGIAAAAQIGFHDFVFGPGNRVTTPEDFVLVVRDRALALKRAYPNREIALDEGSGVGRLYDTESDLGAAFTRAYVEGCWNADVPCGLLALGGGEEVCNVGWGTCLSLVTFDGFTKSAVELLKLVGAPTTIPEPDPPPGGDLVKQAIKNLDNALEHIDKHIEGDSLRELRKAKRDINRAKKKLRELKQQAM